METDLHNKLEALETKLNEVYISVEKTRKYFQIILWVTTAMVVLPIVGLVVVIPKFLNMYTSALGGL